MKELTQLEIAQVSGGALSEYTNLALGGGAGGAAIKAAGGGVAGNIAWRPGFIGLNALLQRIIAAND